MDQEQEEYKVIITDIAEARYYELLEYFYDYYSEERAEELATELRLYPFKLSKMPNRGALEKSLVHRPEKFKFLLYKRVKYAEVKIIYFVVEKIKVVYITDFYATEMNPSKIKDRS